MRDEAKRATSKRLKRSSSARHPSPRQAPARGSRAHTPPAEPRGEFDFIARIRRRALREYGPSAARPSSLIPHPSSLLHGIGDDAAVIRSPAGADSIITADLLVEDVDFRRATTDAASLGHKALAVSLSDIAAMGARPRWALLSVGVPVEVWASEFLEEFYSGFFRLARRHGVTLIGGDVSRTPERIVIDSIVLGETKRGRAVLRSGARVGDQIFVTGSLGGAAAGLEILEGARAGRGRRAPQRLSARAADSLVERQTRPTPRVEWGALIGERRIASAMIDLSDGLSSDLAHLCRESGVGALVEAEALPVHPLLTEMRDRPRPTRAGAARPDALGLALHGGEDFELLFTVRARDVRKLPASLGRVPVTRIGEIRERRFGLKIVREGRAHTLRPEGFDHFSRRQRRQKGGGERAKGKGER